MCTYRMTPVRYSFDTGTIPAIDPGDTRAGTRIDVGLEFPTRAVLLRYPHIIPVIPVKVLGDLCGGEQKSRRGR